MSWHLLHPHHDNLDMLRARLKLLEHALDQIIELADTHEDAETACMEIATLADEARKL